MDAYEMSYIAYDIIIESTKYFVHGWANAIV